MSAGPYELLRLHGQDVPWYMLPFDKDGVCTGPQARRAMLGGLAGGAFTDVYLFSHGWNNDWAAASQRYDDFIYRYAGLRTEHKLAYPRGYKPMLVGLFWPSTALVLPWERAPHIAGSASDAVGTEGEQDFEELSRALSDSERTRLARIFRPGAAFDPTMQRDLAEILAPLWNRLQTGPGVDVPVDPITAGELLALWKGPAPARATDDDGFGGLAGGAPSMGPQAALSLSDVLGAPRDLVRLFTVLRMKDRAGRVGARGVSGLLRDVLGCCGARVHLVGHSYGCIVVLSALSNIEKTSVVRPFDSALLLQAAVSRYCFAERIPGKADPGGYRIAFDRLAQPILATFSKHDGPLTKFFHLAVRRDADLGQPDMAGAPPAPSKYAALGGFGPDGCTSAECRFEDIRDVGIAYDLSPAALRIIGLRADGAIHGHGDISVPATWWALYNQVSAGRELAA